MRRTLPIILFSLVFAVLGCRDHQAVPAPGGRPVEGALGPATKPASFVSTALGISLAWPVDWTPQPNPDYVLMLTGASPGQSISLDVPQLPLHVPGMIPMRLVKNGYLDDLRKRVGSLTVVEDAPRQFPGANAHLVHATWSNGGQEFVEVTQLFVHNDRVYIIRSDSTADAYEATRAAFDAVVQSIRWIKSSP